jgi:hypothetical protein
MSRRFFIRVILFHRGVTKRVVGIVVLMLVARVMIVPFPLCTILPALVIAWISLAYLEEDGLMLSIGLLAGFVVLASICG